MHNICFNDLLIKKCNQNDIDDILLLQDDVFETLNNPTWLRQNTKQMFETCLQDPNITFGLYDGNSLIAVIIMYALKDDEDLSKSLQSHKANNSANFKLIMVKKQYRGNKIMASLMWVLERYAYSKGYTHLCATANAENIYSISNMANLGYEYDSSHIKYNSLNRDIYIKDIEKIQSKYAYIKHDNLSIKDCFLGSIDIANYSDIIEYDNKLGVVELHDTVRFNDGSLLNIKDIKNIKVWISTKQYD